MEKLLFFFVSPKPVIIKFEYSNCLINGFLSNLKFNLKTNLIYNLTDSKILVNKNYLKSFFSLLRNILVGVSYGFKVILFLKGKGLRLQLRNLFNKSYYIYLKLGYSHKIFMKFPKNVWAKVTERRRTLILYSLNLNVITQILHQIRNYYPLSLYKMRGFYMNNEKIRIYKGKLGKSSSSSIF